MESKNDSDQEKFAGVIHIDEQEVRSHVEEVVRESVEETLNGLRLSRRPPHAAFQKSTS
jgi:hypothetical protein